MKNLLLPLAFRCNRLLEYLQGENGKFYIPALISNKSLIISFFSSLIFSIYMYVYVYLTSPLYISAVSRLWF